jgi:hypothetical protein
MLARAARRALAAAERSLARVDAGGGGGGGGLMAASLYCTAFDALVRGGRGPWWRVRDARPLLDRAQRMLDANRPWAPRAVWESLAEGVAERRADLQRMLDNGVGGAAIDEDSTLLPCADWSESSEAPQTACTCGACGARALEMPQCSRCRGTPAQVHYCSPACQRAHWPAHKAACRAAAAAARAEPAPALMAMARANYRSTHLHVTRKRRRTGPERRQTGTEQSPALASKNSPEQNKKQSPALTSSRRPARAPSRGSTRPRPPPAPPRPPQGGPRGSRP